MIYGKTILHNLPAHPEKYVVCRLNDGEFWYWGDYEEKNTADMVASGFENGAVFEMDEGLKAVEKIKKYVEEEKTENEAILELMRETNQKDASFYRTDGYQMALRACLDEISELEGK